MVTFRQTSSQWSLIYVPQQAAYATEEPADPRAPPPPPPPPSPLISWSTVESDFSHHSLLQVKKKYLPVEWENLSLKHFRELWWINRGLLKYARPFAFELRRKLKCGGGGFLKTSAPVISANSGRNVQLSELHLWSWTPAEHFGLLYCGLMTFLPGDIAPPCEFKHLNRSLLFLSLSKFPSLALFWLFSAPLNIYFFYTTSVSKDCIKAGRLNHPQWQKLKKKEIIKKKYVPTAEMYHRSRRAVTFNAWNYKERFFLQRLLFWTDLIHSRRKVGSGCRDPEREYKDMQTHL